MAISTKFIDTAVFISGARHIGGPTDAALVGTGFVATVPTVDPDSGFMYVVTAAHVVRPFLSTFVRLSRHDGTVTDLQVAAESWVFHPVEDVAVAPIVLPAAGISLTIVPTTSFVGVAETEFQPGPGDEVFFPGLLGQVPSMGARNVPMVRGGIIGALHQDGIPMRLPDDTVLRMHGHLIDCDHLGASVEHRAS